MALTYARATTRLFDHVAVPRRPAASAGRRSFHRRSERRVHKIRDASTWPVLVVARIRRMLLARERLRVDLAARQRVPTVKQNHSADDSE